MISGEDESSSVINGRLRPRKSTATIPNPQNKSTYKPENKVAQDKPKRNSTPSKASPNKQDDLTAKADSLPFAQLCPYCDKKFSTRLAASKHARRIHLSTSKQDHFINCLFCNHSEAVSSNIIRHMVDGHPNQYFACLDCNTRFFSTSELAEHKLNVCEKQKQAYRSKLRQNISSVSKKDQKKINAEDKNQYSGKNKELRLEPTEFNGLVISCELKPSHVHDAVDIEDNITTNLILPSNIRSTVLEKNALMILDDIQWNRRIPPNFSFRNADADQILSRLGVVHRSPRVGESTRREWLKMIDVTSQKFEKCFDTNFYSRVASNVQQNLTKFLDGSFNFSPDPDKVIKTRKSKSSAIINTAEGFPILLPNEQYSRNRFDGYMPRAIAPKHKWKWDSSENEKNIILDASVIKRDNHVDNCIITLVSSLDIWTQLRMRRKFEDIFCKAATEKFEKQNVIGRELKEILESREIPSSSSQVIEIPHTESTAVTTVAVNKVSDFPSFLGLTARGDRTESPMQQAVLSGEWVRPRCYVCCACGDQTSDSRALTAHMIAHHPNAQVQHYEIVGESLLNANILKHLYVPPSQMTNRTRPLRGFRDCTKCKKSITMEDLHQHMLDCAGDTPTVRRKCRSRPFGVRRRRPRLPDNTIRKKMRKDLRTRHNQKALLRTRPKIRTEVGDAETIRKMIADLPAKRHRQAAGNLNAQQVLRPRRTLDKQSNKIKIKRLSSKDTKTRKLDTKNNKNDPSVIDEDDQPLKPKTKIEPEKTAPAKKRVSSRVLQSKNKKASSTDKEVPSVNEHQEDAHTTDANASQPLQMSSKNSTDKQVISAKGSIAENEEICDGADKNENGDKKLPDKELNKDNHQSIAPDPALLKHSINSITACSNKTSQPQQHNLLPQQANEADASHDTQNTFFENEVGPSLPEKPPLQSNQKRSSQKKRESLLNCIEKIKSQQKGETVNDPKQTNAGSVIRPTMDNVHLPLMDPHPAIISRTRDESGAAKNVVPNVFSGTAPMGMIGPPYHTEKDRWRSVAESQRNQNEMLMLPPMAESYYAHKKSPEAQLAYPKAKRHTGGQRRKSCSTRLPMTPSEQAAQLQMANLYHQRQWNQGTLPYTSVVQAHLQQQIEQSQRMPFPEMVLKQHQLGDAFKNTQYQNQSLLASGQYNTPNLHYEARRDHVPLCNETPRQTIGTTPENHNILSVYPQSWCREGIQNHQINNTLAVPSVLPSMAANELMIPSTRRTSQKRVSECSEAEYLHGTSRTLDDAAHMSYYAHMRRMSTDTTANMYLPPTGQSGTELSYYTLPRSRAPIEVGRDKISDLTALLTQGEHGKKRKTSGEMKGVVSESTSNDALHYPSEQHHNTAVNQNTSPRGEERNQSNLRSASNIVSANIGVPPLNTEDDTMVKCRYLTDQNKKEMKQKYSTNTPHLTVPPECCAAKITPLSNELTFQTSLDLYERDQVEDLPVGSSQTIDHKIHNSYIEVEEYQDTSDHQTDAASIDDEPLDLSGKHVLAVFNDKEQNVQNDQIRYATSNLSQTPFQQSRKNAFDARSKPEDNDVTSAEINSIKDNTAENSASMNVLTKKQQMLKSVIDVNNDVKMTPIQPSCDRSMVTYCKDIEMTHSTDKNIQPKNVPNITPRQFSHESHIGIETNNRSLFISDVNDIEKSMLHSRDIKVSRSQNPNVCSTPTVPFDRLDKNKEMFTSVLENQSLVKTVKCNKMLSDNVSYHNTEDKAAHSSSASSLINMEPDPLYCGAYNKQIYTQKDLIIAESTQVQNQIFMGNVEETSVDNESVNANLTNTNVTAIEQDPETAKKIASFPKELVDLLGTVPKDKHNKFVDVISQLIPPKVHPLGVVPEQHDKIVNVISQMIPPHNDGIKPNITVQEPQSVPDTEETAKFITPPHGDTSSNTANRLTINTAVLPSSSILPKKRHSPSSRLTTQDPYYNPALSNLPTVLLQQPPYNMSLTPKSTPIENLIERKTDSSTGILQKMTDVNECETNTHLSKVIDLTDDDYDDVDLNSNTPSTNVVPLQEPVNKLQCVPRNSSEQTASLRAVRIKTTGTRKSVSDDKQLMKEMFSQQQIYLEPKQIDLNAGQVSGCNKMAVGNALFHSPEYFASHIINQTEKRTQSFSQIESEANLLTNENIEQIEMNKITSNVVAKDVMKDFSSPYNMGCNDSRVADEVLQRYNKNDSIYESRNSTCDTVGNSQDNFFRIPNPVAPVGRDKDTVYPDSANFIHPELSRDEKKKTPIFSKESDEIQSEPQIDDKEQNISNISKVTVTPLEPLILQHDELKNISTIIKKTQLSEEEDSDDDVSLAVIVKQKQTGSLEMDASTSEIVKNDPPDSKQIRKNKKPKNKPIKLTNSLTHPTDTQLLTVNSNTVSKDITVESEIDEANKNDVDKENHEMYGLEHTRDKEISKCMNKKEDDVRVFLETPIVEKVEKTPVSDMPNEENSHSENPPLEVNASEDAEVDLFQDHLNNKPFNGGIPLSNVETTRQNIKTNEPLLKISELHNITQEVTRCEEINSFIDIEQSQTILQPQSDFPNVNKAFKLCEKEQETPKIVESILLADSDTSTILSDTSERALRRSRREKSMYLNNKESTDDDSGSTFEISQTMAQKIPVTKKQLIFSKLLLDENTHSKNDIKDAATKIKVLSTKRKKSLKKTKKSIKKKSFPVKSDAGNSTTISSNYTPDNNNQNVSEVEPTDASSVVLNHFPDSGDTENKKTFEFKDNEKINEEKQKLGSPREVFDGFNTTKTNANDKDNETVQQQDIDISNDSVHVDIEANLNARTEISESCQVKSNEKIDNPVASTSGYKDLKKQSEKTSPCIEIRTACYNRPIVSKQAGASTSIQNPANYDPYDIDLDMDMAETSRPTVKRKSNKSVSALKSSKKCFTYENLTGNTNKKTEITKPEITILDTLPPNLSDSDSSISDVPLQIYVKEKELTMEDFKSSSNISEKTPEANFAIIESSKNVSEEITQNIDEIFNANDDDLISESDLRFENNTAPPKKSRKEADKIDSTRLTSNRDDYGTDIVIGQVSGEFENTAKPGKLSNKRKRKPRSKTLKKVSKKSKKIKKTKKNNKTKKGKKGKNSVLLPEKCMENFGFYFVRQQRKSNLIAAKKIAETFNIIENDEEISRDRQINSQHAYNIRTTSADGTSRAAAQDISNANYARRNSTAPTIEQHAGPSSFVDDAYQASDDDEVDLITAQKMLESEEIRNLERALYSGFKEAAEANAGRTSGFNQLRAEEANPHVSSPTEVEVRVSPIQSLERPESPERSLSPDMPDSPESLQDKPLMYPEEEVNIYEDKYDIIKRRREANANAKRIQKVDKPKLSKTEKRKKPERKINKKTTKKTIYQVSQVPTKGALKGFDGIKISIPTHDLNMPPNVSPPQQQRNSRSLKRKGSSRKPRANSDYSNISDSDYKNVSNTDVYEFKDEERPVSKGPVPKLPSYRLTRIIDRNRSSSSEEEGKPLKANESTRRNGESKQKDNIQKAETSKTKKWKGKGKGKSKYVNKEMVTPLAQQTVNLEKRRVENALSIDGLTDESQPKRRMDSRMKLNGTLESDGGPSNDYKDTNNLEYDEPFNDSDIEDRSVMPGTSGFVPDRNDESSYDSDSSSSPTPLLSVLKGPYACTCLSEIDSDDSETERGCAHTSCRYSHLNAAKNLVMGKIFKNNAVRCEKSDDTADEPPKPKQDLDRLFDSLLEPTTDTNESATRTIISPVARVSSATYFFTTHVKFPVEALQSKKDFEKDVYNIDDGFSSPNHCESEKPTIKNFEFTCQTSPTEANLLNIDDDSTNNFGETTTVPIDDVYVMVSQKQIQTEVPVQFPAAENSEEPEEEEVPQEPAPLSTVLNNDDDTTVDLLDNIDKVPESSDLIRFKHKRRDVRRTGTQTKRGASKSDVETSEKPAKRKRKENKKHKSHHKRDKTSVNEESIKRRSKNQRTASSKHTRKTRKTAAKKETKVKLSPSRKSDEGISTSHDNSADAFDMTLATTTEGTGAAVQRARRKCTVGKQNVLTEHWSSDSDGGKKKRRSTKGKKRSRKAKGTRRSREAVSGDEASKPPPPKKRARVVPVPRVVVSESIAEREPEPEPKDIKEQELHGWIVGRSHKKLVTMLVCSKSKSRPDDKDEDIVKEKDEENVRKEKDKEEEEEKHEE